MCNERNHSICYTTATYEVDTFKNKNKRESLLRGIFDYHFLVYICLFVAANLFKQKCAYNIAHDENAMSSLIIQSKAYNRVSLKAATGVL